MGIVRMGPPTEIIYKLKEVYGINNFIETGTYQGHTAYWASQLFEQVFTIEYSQDIYQKVTEKYGHIKNIDFLYGDTRNLLQNTLSKLESPSLFWLDAHWSGGLTYGESDECPLLAEIEIINRSDCEHFIFIDDARLFLSPPPPPHLPQQWPDISAILNLLNSVKNSRHIVIVDDVIIAVPVSAKELIVRYCQDAIATLGNTASGKQEENHQTAGVSVNNLNNGESINNYELKIIENFIASGNVVFDIGANIGSWTNQVLNICPDVQIHLFEPAPPIYQTLIQNLAEPIKSGQLVLNNLAIAHQPEIREFYYYEKSSGWSTFHRRFEIEKQYNIQSPQPFQVLTATLDDYVQTRGIKRINFLKIDTEGGELEVLRGATNLLQKGKVDYIQFEYGGTFVDANITLKQVFDLLQKFRYTIFKILPAALQPLPQFSPEYENYEYSNFLAVNERFTALIFSEAPKLLDLQQLCVKHSVVPRGIIHIGAHEGKEIATYQMMGVERVLFVEANPAVFERLQTNMAGFLNVLAVNCAISNINGTSTLHVTSMDQSSSILPLKEHQKIYPQIKEVERVVVESRTLDTLLEELQVNPADFNILNIDIQGAELLALQGATNLLKHIEAINTEVNYEELYEGCALIDQIDDFLETCGFDRTATATPYHPSWGDAFYVKKPVIAMSTLGRNGRFANQIFQYAFLAIYAKEHSLRVETPAWIGQYLFGCNDSPISQELPVVSEETNNLLEARIPHAKETFKNVDFWGYFQYHTKYYAAHKEYFRSLFKPVPAIATKMKEALDCLRSRARGKTIVGLHLRRGDYGYSDFFIAPSEWYREWLKGLWETLDEPILFIASDEPEKVLSDFEEYNPITTKDLGLELAQAEFYPDFYLLSQCDIVAISNSSFSFAACMLNETGKSFFRPHLSAEKLIPFDPWNSEPMLRNYMPIHFFTIVLNGEPFIHYHIEVLQQLPFKWHWHIIEGVADQKHDSAWMLSLGGKITDELHCGGRSKDGTSDYIDEIARLYPKNITVYRKPEGIFWDGKREMVNAPLENIKEECLLWQVDTDELWTAEQICTARQMFINHPEKTAAFYWCWYFVGENLVISSRNCYAQNPQQDWLRTWRFKPGASWASHEPPRLVEALPNSECRDVAAVNPFLHEETEKQGLVFQHFAYVTLEQLRFKQIYYGYKNAVVEWMALQAQTEFPVRLGNYFSWVQDETMVDSAESLSIVPIAQRENEKNTWHFVQREKPERQIPSVEKFMPRVIVDGVFFQLYNTGIARVWRSLLEEWVHQDFAKHIIVLDRAGTAPKIPGITYCPVPAYDYDNTEGDREMLQQVCDELEADLFISTYYTTPLSTPSVFIAYDMTPEVFEANLDEPMWREKHYGIRHASAYITISHNTASDLLKYFSDIAPELVTVAHCGVAKNLSPASPEEIENFKIKYNLSKPYFMMVGAAGGHKNAPLFLQAFAQLPNQPEFDIVCTAHSALTKDEFEPYTSGSTVHKLPLTDEELKAAFSGAVALVYPSQYEGFGLPILEAMACGCPVITCPNASIPEVAGEAALYVKDDDVEAMAIALIKIQKPEVREVLIAAGIEQAKKFSWLKMAKTVSSVFIKVFQEKESMQILQENSKEILPTKDYISPEFAIVKPDKYFPNMIVGDPNLQPWPYLRREIPHNWYVDKRYPTVGFLSRDEAHILYNTALQFKGKKALEIGCWLGWSACHLALAGVELEVVDPLLARPDFYESISNSLQAAGVLESIHLVAGYSPQAVEELAAQLQTKWSLIFIDGNHEAPGPLNDAIICEQLAAENALIVFHDLAAPDVAQGLDYFKQKGWHTLVYQTMQIMGVAWRGNVEPVIHQPDPKVNWVLPPHLQSYTVSGMSNDQSVDPFLNKLFDYVEEYQLVSDVRSYVDFSGDHQKFAELIEKGKECFVKGEIETAIATFTQALEVHHSSLIPHNYLTSLYWQVGDVQKSLQHHIQAQFSNMAFDNTLTDEFKEILSVIKPYTLLSEARLFSLYSLARQICLDDIPGNFVECGSYKGGSAALLAVVIERYSLRPRVVYAFDTFEGMPEPTEADQHNGIPANLTDWGAGTLKAPLTDNLDVICQSLDVADIVIPVKGLFAQTLPESKSAIGSIALLHADGDWYESTMDIFNNIYDRVVPNGFIQIDDYGHWDGCKKAIHEFEKRCGQSFALRAIDYTGVWFQKEDSVHQDCNHWRTFWHLAQASEKMGNIDLAQKAAQAVLKIMPKLVKAENLLNRDRSQLKLVVSPEVSQSGELDDFLNNLRLREINIILFPDWQQPEESLCLQLEGVITTLFAQKEPSKITALLDISNISEEDANLVLSSVIINILMQEDLDETDIPEFSLLGNLSKMQWKALLPCIHYRVVLENENLQAVAQSGAGSLPCLKAANLTI